MKNTKLVKIWRDITSQKTRTILVTASIFVGVLAVVVLTTLGSLLKRQLLEDLQPSQMAMLRVYVSPSADTSIDNEAVLESLETQPGVTIVEGQAVYQFAWRLEDSMEVREGQLFSYSQPFGQIQLDPIRLYNGRFPIEGQNEIAIEQRMAQEYGLRVDDRLDIRQADGTFSTWQITGIIFQPYIYIGSSPQNSAYMAFNDAESVIGFNGYTSIFARFENFETASQESRAFRTAISKNTPYKISFYLIENPAKSAITVGVERFARVLRLLAVVAIIVASFLISNNIVAIISEQYRQIGILKAIGATRLDIFSMYLGIAAVYGLLGTFPAILIGIPLGQYIAEYVAPTVNVIIRNSTPPLSVPLMALALGIGIPLLAALLPAYRASQLSILESTTNLGISRKYNNGPIQRLIIWIPFPLFIEQSLNNILKTRWRVALTGVTLTLAATAFMSILAVIISLYSVLNETRQEIDISRLSGGNVKQAEAFSSFTQLLLVEEDRIHEFQPGVAIELQAIPISGEDENSASAIIEAPEATTIFVTGIDTTTSLDSIPLLEGEGWIENPNLEGIVLSDELARKLKVVVGDELHLNAPDSQGDFAIIGISDYPLEVAFMEWQHLSQFVGSIRDAPVPNTYWEQIQVYSPLNQGADQTPQTIWVVGIDDELGQYLSPNYDEHGILINDSVAQSIGAQVYSPLVINYISPQEDLLDTLTEFSEDVAEEIGNERPIYPVTDIVSLSRDEIDLLLQYAPPEVLEQDEPLLAAMYWVELANVSNLDYREVSPKTYYLDIASPPRLTTLTNYSAPRAAYNNQLSFADSIAQTIFSLAIVMNTAALFMGIIGGIGLLTTSSMNVRERQREIGVMRSVGASSRDIILQFYSEGLIISLICWVTAVPLSYYLGRFLLNLVPFKEIIHYQYTLTAPLAGLVGIVTIASMASFYPAILASRKTVSEILRY